jgi:hypothetical protein
MELLDCLGTRENNDYSINFHVFIMCVTQKHQRDTQTRSEEVVGTQVFLVLASPLHVRTLLCLASTSQKKKKKRKLSL